LPAAAQFCTENPTVSNENRHPCGGSDSASAAKNNLCRTSVKMLFSHSTHKSLKKQLNPAVRIVTVRLALFSADALLLKTFAVRRLPRNDLPGEVSLLCGELALPLSGGSRQPLDRQVSYYSELLRLASELKAPQTQETPLQRVALHCSALVTGLPNNSWAAVVSAAPTSDFPTGLPL
jgi:hypothetical protein